METKANYVAIGLFTLILTAVGFGFVYWIARYDDVRPMKDMVVRFEGSVAGLIKGGQVMFNGIKVGEVSNLTYDPENPKFVRALLRVDSDIPLKKDSRIELAFQGLTGLGMVEIKGGSPELPDLLDQDEIPQLDASSSALQDLMSGARQVLTRADSVLSKVERVVDTNEARINNSIENVETFTSALKNNSDNIDTFLADASSAAKGLTTLSTRLETLSDRAETLLSAVDPQSVQKSVQNVEVFTEKLASTSNKFDTIVDDAASATKGINEFSSSLSASLGKVDEVVTSVDEVVKAVDPEAVKAAVGSMTKFAKSLDASSGDIASILDEAKTAAGNINQFSQTMSSRSEDFNQIVTDARQIASRLNDASKRVDGILGKVDTMLSDGEGGKGLVEEVTLAARSIRRVSESFEARADEISSGLARFSGKGLRDVESMVSEARQTLRRLEGAVGKLEDDPSSLIFGGPKVKTYNRRY